MFSSVALLFLIIVWTNTLTGQTTLQQWGSNNYYGYILSMDINGQNATTSYTAPNTSGSTPWRNRLTELSPGILLGTTFNTTGDNAGAGTVYLWDLNKPGVSYKLLYTFPDDGSMGKNPEFGCVKATNGNFYGITSSGGTYGDGVIFEVNATTQ